LEEKKIKFESIFELQKREKKMTNGSKTVFSKTQNFKPFLSATYSFE